MEVKSKMLDLAAQDPLSLQQQSKWLRLDKDMQQNVNVSKSADQPMAPITLHKAENHLDETKTKEEVDPKLDKLDLDKIVIEDTYNSTNGNNGT